MIDESKLIFFTGTPGSKWSAVSYVLGLSDKWSVNTSDRTENRCFIHPEKKSVTRHTGSYFGPGFELGNKFRDINELTKQEVMEEIESVWEDDDISSYRIIRCHQFVYNLDWIRENFPTSKIMIVMRPDYMCASEWFGSGGFDITYPVYEPYYKNEKRMREMITEESILAREWIYKNDIAVHTVDKQHWKNTWNITDYAKDSVTDKYIRTIDGYVKKDSNPISCVKYDVTVAYVNFEDILGR